jgi:hypothetical protein
MIDFGLRDVKFVPEIDEIDVNPAKLQKILQELEVYNKDCRLWKKYDDTGAEIPMRYRGRNRYWAVVGNANDPAYGEYPVISVYDLDPETLDGRILICRYRPARAAQKNMHGTQLDAVPLQTLAQAEKSMRAARLEAERQERMAKKDPKLTSEINVHIPLLYAPDAARRKIDVNQ